MKYKKIDNKKEIIKCPRCGNIHDYATENNFCKLGYTGNFLYCNKC